MADPEQSAGEKVKRLQPFTEHEPKTLETKPSGTFFDNREYKSFTGEKYRSHQTLSFKRNLLDLEFNAAHGDSDTKKCTEDLIDLFERKSNATNALPVADEKAESPRRKEFSFPVHKEEVAEKKSRLATILAETEEELSTSNERATEDLPKADEFSLDYESTEETIEKEEPSIEIGDKLPESELFQSEFVYVDKRESISETLDEGQALITDNISSDGELTPQEDLQVIESVTTDEVTNNFLNRIKNLKQSMDEINSMIAIEKDFLRQEKLELENSLSLVPIATGRDLDTDRLSAEDPRKVLEEMRQRERKLKMAFQMKQIAEAQRECSNEMQLISNSAIKVEQLNQDMAVFSIADLGYKVNNSYSLSRRSARPPNPTPNNSPRIGPAKTPPGSILPPCPSDSFDSSLMSPIEFTMRDTRLQLQAADHFKMKISQLEAELYSDSFHSSPQMFSPKRAGRISPRPHTVDAQPMKALT